MASIQQRGGARQGIVGINVTPMVDVVLVLLVIMMVSATYIVSQSLKVELPKTSNSDESTPQVAAVTVTKGRAYLWNEEALSEEQLVLKLRGAIKDNPDVNLVVSADENASHGSVVHVIDLAKTEGIVKFAINVDKTK